MKRGRVPGKKVIQAVMQEDSGLETGVGTSNVTIPHGLGTVPSAVIFTLQASGEACHVMEVSRSATNIVIKSDATGAGADVKWKVIA